MLMIICAKYENNPSRIVRAAEPTQKGVSNLNSVIAKPWLIDTEGIDWYQRSLCLTPCYASGHLCLIWNNPSRTVGATLWTRGIMDGCTDRRVDSDTPSSHNLGEGVWRDSTALHKRSRINFTHTTTCPQVGSLRKFCPWGKPNKVGVEI